jgi:hypothetical protein
LEAKGGAGFRGRAAGDEVHAAAGSVSYEQRGEERWGFDEDDIQTCTGTAKRKGNDETNAMMCSPSSKDERRRRKTSPELGKITEATSDLRDRAHHGVELDERNSRVVSICTGSARFLRKSSPEVRRNLVDAKVQRGFVGARVIETERGWRLWKEDAKEIAGNYLLAEIESDFIFLFL